MGGGQSTQRRFHLPVPESFPGFCMFFSKSDALTLVHSDENLIDLIKILLLQNWPKGIQKMQDNFGAVEYILNGWPFGSTGLTDTNSDSLEAQIMCGNLMRSLLWYGWTLVGTSDLTRGNYSQRSAWFFRRSTPQTLALSDRWASVPSFTISRSDRLIFLHISQQMQQELIALCNKIYQKGSSQVRQLGSNGIRIKFSGNPWGDNSRLENEARPLLLAVIQHFEQRGYWFYGTASIQGETDTVYFMPVVFPWPLRLNPPLEPAESNRYFAIGLDCRDRLRVLNCPDPSVIGIIESTIKQFWRRGIEQIQQIGNWFEFNMAGWPWDAHSYETIEARMLITQIFQNLHMNGWAIMAALDTSRAIDDTSLLVFRTTPPYLLHYMCLSLNEMNKIRLIFAPPYVVEAVRMTIQSNYIYGIKRLQTYGDVPEFELYGEPWSGAETSYSVLGRKLLMFVMDCLINQGFALAISADVSAKFYSKTDKNGITEKYKVDVHSWFFARPVS